MIHTVIWIVKATTVTTVTTPPNENTNAAYGETDKFVGNTIFKLLLRNLQEKARSLSQVPATHPFLSFHVYLLCIQNLTPDSTLQITSHIWALLKLEIAANVSM